MLRAVWPTAVMVFAVAKIMVIDLAVINPIPLDRGNVTGGVDNGYDGYWPRNGKSHLALSW